MAAYGGPRYSNNVTDFVEYWGAARQVLAGRDPYAAEALLTLERQVDPTRSRALVMPNPPWTMLVIVPFAWLPFAAGQQIWLAVGLIAIFVSARWLWELYHIQAEPPWVAWLATGLFLPIAVALAIGQISPLVLLGIAGFLHFEKQQKKPAWAGVFLFLVMLKPHLVFLFWIALLLWSVRTRSMQILAALAAVTVMASLAVIALDRQIFSQYANFLGRGVLTEVTPTLSGLLRLSLGGRYALQLLPTLIATFWFLMHWIKSREVWEWRREMPVLLLISLLTVSYAFFFDQIVLLPCVFQAAAWATTSRKLAWMGVAALYLITNAAVLALILGHRTMFWYAWTVPAWCLLYAIARVAGRRSPVCLPSA